MGAANASPLQPLVCQSCGGAVPVGADPVVTCPFCRSEVTVPPEYHELHTASLNLRSSEVDARELLRKLGREPGPVSRFLARDLAAIGLIAFLGFLILPSLGPTLLENWVTADHPGLTLDDALLPAERTSIYAGIAFAAMAPLAILSAFLGRDTYLHTFLEDVLWARPPLHDGGPMLCRSCGAPLHVERNATSVHCMYCRTQNMVTPRRCAASNFVTHVEGDLAVVDAAREAVHARRRRVALSIAGRLGAMVIICGGFWWFHHIEHLPEVNDTPLVNWRMAAQDSWCEEYSGIYPELSAPKRRGGRPSSACGYKCLARVWVPLVAGRPLDIKITPISETEKQAASRYYHPKRFPDAPIAFYLQWSPESSQDRESIIADDERALPTAESFVPKRSGYYQIWVTGKSFVRLELGGEACEPGPTVDELLNR